MNIPISCSIELIDIVYLNSREDESLFHFSMWLSVVDYALVSRDSSSYVNDVYFSDKTIDSEHCATSFQLIACINSSSPGQCGRYFADDILKCIFYISIRISQKFVAMGTIDNRLTFAQKMAWRRTGDKPLPEPVLIRFIGAYMWH